MSKEKKKRNEEILELRDSGLSLRKIARMYMLHHTTIDEIYKRMKRLSVEKAT